MKDKPSAFESEIHPLHKSEDLRQKVFRPAGSNCRENPVSSNASAFENSAESHRNFVDGILRYHSERRR